MSDAVLFANAYCHPLWVMIEKEGQKVSTVIAPGKAEPVHCGCVQGTFCSIFIEYGEIHRGSIMLTKLYGPLDLGVCSNVVVDAEGRVDRSDKENPWLDSKGTDHTPQ
ncbi:hypothetical protein L596_022024 [Steinernema carpocapsae]|nr:hypothetical protein L596_022024 [Steinernema carpocapsae]